MDQDIEARLRRVEDELAIMRVLSAYCQAIDYGDAQGWSETFTEDGVFDIRDGVGAPVFRFEGRPAIRAWAEGHSRAPERWHRHATHGPVITLDGDRATVVSHYTILGVADDEPVIAMFGRYRDDFVRDADGRWRMRLRVAESAVQRPEAMPTVDPALAGAAAAAAAAAG